MATQIKTTGPVSRGDVFRLNPEDVILGTNSRVREAADYPEQVKQRALSIVKHGQLQPTRGHKDADGRVVLDIGHTRYDAVKLIRKGFEAVDDDGEKRYFVNAEQQLDVIVDRNIKTAADAFVASIVENSSRDNTTDVQEALAQAELREVYGYTNARIARLYGYSNSNRVGYLQQLLTLPQAIVDRVHAGDLTLHAALAIQKVPEGEKKDELVTAIANGAEVTADEVKQVAREELPLAEEVEIESTEGNEEPKPPVKKTKTKAPSDGLSRSVRDFRKFNEELQDESTVAADVAKKLFQYLEEWFAGSRQDRSLWAVIAEIKGHRTEAK